MYVHAYIRAYALPYVHAYTYAYVCICLCACLCTSLFTCLRTCLFTCVRVCLQVGQAQLIRRQVANELNFSCKLDSQLLCSGLEYINKSLLSDVQAHYLRPDSKSYPGNPVLPDVSEYLENTGINNPISKIYITSEPLPGFPCLMFLFVLSQVGEYQWNKKLSTLESLTKQRGYYTSRSPHALDGAPLVVGVVTLLKQFHSLHTHTFLQYLGQYVRAHIAGTGTSKKDSGQLPENIVNVLLFLEEFCRFSRTSRDSITAIIPQYIFDRFRQFQA